MPRVREIDQERERLRRQRIRCRIGANIRSRRELAGLTQYALGAQVDVGETVVSRWERGVVLPTPACLGRLAQALDCDPGDLSPLSAERRS